MKNTLKICMAQMEVIPANPQENLKKILKCIEKGKEDGADIICLSEMVIPGYLIGDIWERTSFLKECEEALEEVIKASHGITIIIGSVFVDWNKKNEDGRVRKYNTCFVIKDGEIVNTVYKTLQPNYREFDDNRHFYDYRKLISETSLMSFKNFYFPSIAIKGINIGCVLCEDSWDQDYSFSPVNSLYENGCDLIVNISCSPYTSGKNNKRNRVFGEHAKKYGKPMVYVNNIGVQNNGKNIFMFDGNSCIYDKNGNQINPYKEFTEGCSTIEIDIDKPFGNVLNEDEGIKTSYNAILFGMKTFMSHMGINKVVIGASGGIDSAVVAALISKILPPENIMLVNMPSSYNSNITKTAAEDLAYNIGCIYKVIPIQESVDLTKRQLKKVGIDLNSFAVENVQARDRSSRILAACAASFGGVFTCNANKSEATVGYTTLYGDLGGFMAPLADLWKGQVYELAKYINAISDKDIIPKASIEVKPSAELGPNQDITKGLGDPIIYPYHDKLFASWVERWNRVTPEEILSWYIDGTLCHEIGYEGSIKDIFKTTKDFIEDLERWWKCYSGLSVAKRIQAPPIVTISRRSFGFDHREAQLPVYYSKKYLEMKEKLLGE